MLVDFLAMKCLRCLHSSVSFVCSFVGIFASPLSFVFIGGVDNGADDDVLIVNSSQGMTLDFPHHIHKISNCPCPICILNISYVFVYSAIKHVSVVFYGISICSFISQ